MLVGTNLLLQCRITWLAHNDYLVALCRHSGRTILRSTFGQVSHIYCFMQQLHVNCTTSLFRAHSWRAGTRGEAGECRGESNVSFMLSPCASYVGQTDSSHHGLYLYRSDWRDSLHMQPSCIAYKINYSLSMPHTTHAGSSCVFSRSVGFMQSDGTEDWLAKRQYWRNY